MSLPINATYIRHPDAYPNNVTETGFEFGPITVERLCTTNTGGVALLLCTAKGDLYLTVHKDGQVYAQVQNKNKSQKPKERLL